MAAFGLGNERHSVAVPAQCALHSASSACALPHIDYAFIHQILTSYSGFFRNINIAMHHQNRYYLHRSFPPLLLWWIQAQPVGLRFFFVQCARGLTHLIECAPFSATSQSMKTYSAKT